MLGVLLSALVILILGAVIPALASDKETYGSKLEEYIVSHNPNDTYDVERLTREYDEKQQRGIL